MDMMEKDVKVDIDRKKCWVLSAIYACVLWIYLKSDHSIECYEGYVTLHTYILCM